MNKLLNEFLLKYSKKVQRRMLKDWTLLRAITDRKLSRAMTAHVLKLDGT